MFCWWTISNSCRQGGGRRENSQAPLTLVLEHGKTIAIASAVAPFELAVDDALIRRLSTGAVIELEPLEPEVKVTILSRKAADAEFDLPLNVAEYLAASETISLGQMLGVLTTLVARWRAMSQHPSVAIARELMQNTAPKLTLAKIARIVAKHCGTSIEAITATSNSPSIVVPRQIAMYLAVEAGFSISEIARELGKHHSTVLHSVRKVENELKTDPKLHDLLLTISDDIDH
jgi:chromosomal replication initiator protein